MQKSLKCFRFWPNR